MYLLTSYGSFLAFFILGASLIAVGVFISSLTDSQGFAAGIGIAVILLNYYSVSLSEHASSTSLGSVISLCVVIFALGTVIKRLTKNENLAYGVCIVFVVLIAIVSFLDSSKFEDLLPGIMTKLSLFNRFNTFRFRLFRKLHSGGNFFAFAPDSLRWTRGRVGREGPR